MIGVFLISKGCEPLQRRRCFMKTIPKVGLHPHPLSLWRNVREKIYIYSGLGCKNLIYLSSKKLIRDCVGCFDLANGNENQRFAKSRVKNDFLIDDVLALGSGGIRIIFDIGDGSSAPTSRMAEKNVTATLNC